MDNKDLNSDNNISLMKIKSPAHLLTLKNNKNFCNKFFERSAISSVTDKPDYFGESYNLVYDLSRASNLDIQAFKTIIDLLMQLRAAGSDQNVLIQNNTVIREQILSQLKNEILRVSHKLTKNQIKNLEVISSNSFDEKTLTDILKSLLEGSKKKLTDSKPAGADFHVKKTSRYITLDKISKSYLNILSKSLYYEKFIDKILKNISYEKITSKNELVKLKPDKKSLQPRTKIYLKRRSLKELLTKKSQISTIKFLEEIIRSHEENVINKIGLIPHIIKIQSKISEANILTKAETFVQNIIKNSVPKILSSETELVNKIISTSKIDELRENMILTQRQYLEDRIHQERNISRIYNEVRKLYSNKNLSRSITEILKSTNAKSFNIEENVKKNLLKLTSKKDIINRFKNIYDHAVENVSVNRVTEKSELVNRESVKHTDIEEKTAVRDIVNLKRSGTIIDKKFIEDIRENNILMQDSRIRRRNYERIHKNLEKVSRDFYEDDNFRSLSSAFNLINLKKFSVSDFEDHFIKFKNIFINQNKRNILVKQHHKIAEDIENKIKKEIFSISEKEVHEKLKFISSKEDLSILKRGKIIPAVTAQGDHGTRVEVWAKEDFYKFIPVHLKENILSEDEIKNIFSKNIIKVLSPKIMRSKSFKVHQKNIYKDLTERQISKYVEKSYDLKKEYLINERVSVGKESQYGHISQDYMIYKELENYQKNEKIPEKGKKPPKKEEEPDIVIKEKPVKPEIIDPKAIEKNIMSKTLNKKDIVALIESYMEDINIESISQTVIGKVERKFVMDRRRNGIF